MTYEFFIPCLGERSGAEARSEYEDELQKFRSKKSELEESGATPNTDDLGRFDSNTRNDLKRSLSRSSETDQGQEGRERSEENLEESNDNNNSNVADGTESSTRGNNEAESPTRARSLSDPATRGESEEVATRESTEESDTMTSEGHYLKLRSVSESRRKPR